MNELKHHVGVDHIEHPSHAKIGIHTFPDKLHVMTMMYNPLRWRKRYENYWKFHNMCKAAGVVLYTAEVAYGDREFEITDPNNPFHLQLRTSHELWLKENALNLMLQRVTGEYVAWIDADVQFGRHDWAQETLHLLQHYKVIQMFSHTQNLGPNYEPLERFEGYVYKKITDPTFNVSKRDYYGYLHGNHGSCGTHPGFAWAARKSSLSDLGGLIDWAILGSADWHMAAGLMGEIRNSLGPNYHSMYKELCMRWEMNAEKYIQRKVGYMPGLVMHHFHGKMKNRFYMDRWKVIVDTQFNPLQDMKKDWQGLYQLTDRSMQLRDGLMTYNRMRDEDSTDV